MLAGLGDFNRISIVPMKLSREDGAEHQGKQTTHPADLPTVCSPDQSLPNPFKRSCRARAGWKRRTQQGLLQEEAAPEASLTTGCGPEALC